MWFINCYKNVWDTRYFYLVIPLVQTRFTASGGRKTLNFEKVIASSTKLTVDSVNILSIVENLLNVCAISFW